MNHSPPLHGYFLEDKLSSLLSWGPSGSASHSQMRRNRPAEGPDRLPQEKSPLGLSQSYLANLTLQLVLVQLYTVLGVGEGRDKEGSIR